MFSSPERIRSVLWTYRRETSPHASPIITGLKKALQKDRSGETAQGSSILGIGWWRNSEDVQATISEYQVGP